MAKTRSSKKPAKSRRRSVKRSKPSRYAAVSSQALSPASMNTSTSSAQSWLQLGQLRSEKCELLEAKIAFDMALQEADRTKDLRSMMEAIAGLLRLAGEGLD